MHQPTYVDPLTGEFEMPWVFLHAIKDYYDMPRHVEEAGIKATFNLTPCLIEQLQLYESDPSKCRFLSLMKKPVSKLTRDEKKHLLKFLFKGNLKNMIMPLRFYYELFLKKERSESEEEFLSWISNQDFLNLEVLFLLSWTGAFVRRESDVVKNLIKKESVFSEEEKLRLIDELLKFSKKVLPLYSKLKEEGLIELTTTPYYHPILPLLIDMQVAKQATPDVKLPAVHATFKDDALLQVKLAKEKFLEAFGFEPEGVWPAEGAVSEDALRLLKGEGFRWSATDEEILFKSLHEKTGDRSPLYRVYEFEGLKIFFRDRTLSDLIGFSYANWKAQDAVNDFKERLRKIRQSYGGAVVSVILDGENCWESYESNGKDFISGLYKSLAESDECETVLPSDVKATSELKRVFAGSWIGGNFLTWVGDEEKNRAWELLGLTKVFYETRQKDGNDEALKCLLTAEGSDWFWWFGKGHFTEFSDVFDYLFRANLMKVYKSFGQDIPDELLSPVKSSTAEPVSQEPNFYIKPIIDGKITSYFEWLNAGKIPLAGFSAMETSSFRLKELYYGYDEDKNLYIRIDGKFEDILEKGYSLEIEMIGKQKLSIITELSKKCRAKVKKSCMPIEAAVDKIFEAKIPLRCLNVDKDGIIEVCVKLFQNGRLVEEVPLFGFAKLNVAKEFTYEWMV